MLSEKFMTATNAAKQLKLTSGHIRQLCIDGKFPGAEKMGKTSIIQREAVDNYHPTEKGFAVVWKKRQAEKATLDSQIQQAIEVAKTR